MSGLLAAVVRLLIFAGTLVLLGDVAFRGAVLSAAVRRAAPPADVAASAARMARNLALTVALAMAPAVVLRFVLQAGQFADDLGWVAALRAVLFHTVWGRGWTFQLTALTAFIVVTWAGRRRPPAADRAGREYPIAIRWVTILAAVGLAIAPATTGHAMASPNHAVFATLADSIHVAAAGTWLGTLLLLVTVGVPSASRMTAETGVRFVAEMVRAFSPLALLSAAAVVATGVVATWMHVDTLASLWRSTYGRLLLAKLTVFVCILAIGAYNWRRVTPRLTTVAGRGELARSAAFELVFAGVLLMITAVLVAAAPPGEG